MHDELKRCVERLRAQRGQRRTPLGAIPSGASSFDAMEQWRAQVGKASEYMTVFDLDLRIRYVNRLQAGLSDVVGSSVLEWLAPPQRVTFVETAAFAHLTGLPSYYDAWGAGPHGQQVGYRSWIVPLPMEEGERQFVGISVDISHVGRVERELEEQSSVLSSIARDAPDHIMILDREHRVQYVNHLLPEFEAIGVLGRTAESLLPESERARVHAALELVFQSGEPTSYDTPLDQQEGRRWYATRAGPIMRDGKVERVLLISSDVTQQRSLEAAAAYEKNVLDGLERVNRRIVRESDPDAMIAAVLEELSRIFAAARVTLCAPRGAEHASFRISHEQRREDMPPWRGQAVLPGSAHHAHLSAALDTTKAAVFSGGRAPGFGGGQAFEAVPLVLSIALYPGPDAPWILSIHCDESRPDMPREQLLLETLAARVAEGLKSLLAQRALRQSEERFRTLVEHAPEAIIIMDVDSGRFVEANANAEQLFGMSREVLLRSGFVDLCPERQPDGQLSSARIDAALRETLEGKPPTFELSQRDARGRPLFCEVRLVHLPHPERRLVRGSISDISARKRAEEDNRALAAQLAQAQKMQAIGQLTGGIAHDFNNLLTVILGSLALMDLESKDANAVREFARQADAAAQRAASLTQRLLAFSRRQPLRPQTVGLRALLSGMEQLLRRTLHESITLEVQVAPETWCCEADPVQLESAILNLAINARDAMPSGGLLQIFADNVAPSGEDLAQVGLPSSDYVRILVRDTGTGMAPEVLAQAFEPFFTTKDVGEGSGLGLSMVYGFLKQSGGHVQIKSELGKGTEVALHLPRSKRSTTPEKLLVPSVQPSGEGRLILVVEDDAGVRQLVCEMLGRLGYRTLAAEDAGHALRLLPERPDIAMMLTDMALPGGMSGAELVASVRAERPRLPILFMTGYSSDAIVHDQRRTHGVGLLAKPFSRASLAAAVLETLGEGEAEPGG